MKTNTWVWVALLLLSAFSFSIGGRTAIGLVLVAAGLKSALVGRQFMELRSAHLVWTLELFALLTFVLGLVYLLGQA